MIETWSFATFLKPDARPVGVEYLGAILLNFALLAAWAALRDLAEGPYDPNFSIRQMLKMRLFRRGPETRALDN